MGHSFLRKAKSWGVGMASAPPSGPVAAAGCCESGCGPGHFKGAVALPRQPRYGGGQSPPPRMKDLPMPQLIRIRHGQSQWNLENRFTGWWDVDVTEKGAAEAWAAGELMKAKGIAPDTSFTSVQTRAIKTLNLALDAMGRLWLPVTKDWHLNERHYGGLTGLDKAETAAKHGDEQVKIWRRSLDRKSTRLNSSH